ncbi:MAG: LysR substrate-binding domain-containing protein, partial [Oceanobacter sp.]
ELGDQLQEVMQLGIDDRPVEFRVGIVDALPKSIAHKLISPALGLPGNMRIICHEEQMSTLLGELAVHRLDIVLADSPMPPGMNIQCFNHALGESPLACFAAPELANQISQSFPDCLKDAPILLPTDTASGLRTELMSWFKRSDLPVRVTGEFDDSALLKAFGSQGHGFFFAPDVIREEICSKYQVHWIGTVEDLTQEFYAISADRKITHPAVRAITEQKPLG